MFWRKPRHRQVCGPCRAALGRKPGWLGWALGSWFGRAVALRTVRRNPRLARTTVTGEKRRRRPPRRVWAGTAGQRAGQRESLRAGRADSARPALSFRAPALGEPPSRVTTSCPPTVLETPSTTATI